MPARATAEVEHAPNAALTVGLEDSLDQVALGQVVLVLIQIVVRGGVLATENGLRHRVT